MSFRSTTVLYIIYMDESPPVSHPFVKISDYFCQSSFSRLFLVYIPILLTQLFCNLQSKKLDWNLISGLAQFITKAFSNAIIQLDMVSEESQVWLFLKMEVNFQGKLPRQSILAIFWNLLPYLVNSQSTKSSPCEHVPLRCMRPDTLLHSAGKKIFFKSKNTNCMEPELQKEHEQVTFQRHCNHLIGSSMFPYSRSVSFLGPKTSAIRSLYLQDMKCYRPEMTLDLTLKRKLIGKELVWISKVMEQEGKGLRCITHMEILVLSEQFQSGMYD